MMMDDMADRDWVIRKNGYFYRPGRCGYTQEICAAGRYTEAEAKAEARVEKSISAHLATEFRPVYTPADTDFRNIVAAIGAGIDADEKTMAALAQAARLGWEYGCGRRPKSRR
jgi:hypothetical protein